MNGFAPLLLAWFGWFVAALPLCGDESISGVTFGSVSYTVRWREAPATWAAERVAEEVARTLDDIDARMSTYRADSEVSRFNADRSCEPFPVSPATARVVRRALEVSHWSGGAFDITVGPLVRLWNFGPAASDDPQLPAAEEIDRLRTRVGYQKLLVRDDPPALLKADPELEIDLSAIAKGYAVDCIAERLDAAGIEHYLVEVGGEVRARGSKSVALAWRVGIVRPVPGSAEFDDVVELRNQSLATSGDYRNFFEIGGRRYSHTIDPATGKPVEHALASASVIAPDCMTADALATAVSVLGAARGHELCQRLGFPLFTIEHRAGGLQRRVAEGFPLQSPARPAASLATTAVAAAIVFALVLAAMAVGVAFGKRRIHGSCGGLANHRDADGKIRCGMCGNPARDCREGAGAAADRPSSHVDH